MLRCVAFLLRCAAFLHYPRAFMACCVELRYAACVAIGGCVRAALSCVCAAFRGFETQRSAAPVLRFSPCEQKQYSLKLALHYTPGFVLPAAKIPSPPSGTLRNQNAPK